MSSKVAYDRWHAQLGVDEAAVSPWHLMAQSRLRPDQDLVGKRVLEIGCGRGGFSCWLARQPNRPAEIVAADFSSTAVEMARDYAESRGIGGITWTTANIQALEQFGSEFDTVISFETIEHVPDPPLAVRELSRVLRPGGRLYLTTPNYFSSIGLYRVYCWVRGKTFDENGQPICQVTMIQKTRAWVKAAGLRIIETDTTGQYLPFPGRPPIRLNWLEHPHPIMKWFGFHTLVVAEKPSADRA